MTDQPSTTVQSPFPPPAPPQASTSAFEWRALYGPLAAAETGPPNGIRVNFVHGFTQTGNSWKPVAERLAALGYLVTVVDLPGHGGSAHVRADLRRTADLLATVGGEGTYVGYSLGGRACLHLALMYPHLVQSLVLIGASPGIDDDDERAARRDADDELARHVHEVGVEAFLDEWVTQPLFGDLQLTAADRADRLRNTADGLASSLHMAGTGAQGSLWARLRELNMPVLAIAGAHDEKFAALARQIAALTPEGQYRIMDGAAHAVHLQQPDAVAALIANAVVRYVT